MMRYIFLCIFSLYCTPLTLRASAADPETFTLRDAFNHFARQMHEAFTTNLVYTPVNNFARHMYHEAIKRQESVTNFYKPTEHGYIPKKKYETTFETRALYLVNLLKEYQPDQIPKILATAHKLRTESNKFLKKIQDKYHNQKIDLPTVTAILLAEDTEFTNGEHPELAAAYHEAGHAFLTTLSRTICVHQANIKEIESYNTDRSTATSIVLPFDDQTHVTEQYLLDRICLCYGGGISEHIFKKSYENNKNVWRTWYEYYHQLRYGAAYEEDQSDSAKNPYLVDDCLHSPACWGDRGHIEHSIIGYCCLYIFPKYGNDLQSHADEIITEIADILQTTFDQAYTAIEANKDQVEAIAHTLYKKELIFAPEIYKLAGSKRPKYFFERPEYIKAQADNQKFHDLLATPAALQIQAAVRGYLARKQYPNLQAEHHKRMKLIEQSLPRPHTVKKSMNK